MYNCTYIHTSFSILDYYENDANVHVQASDRSRDAIVHLNINKLTKIVNKSKGFDEKKKKKEMKTLKLQRRDKEELSYLQEITPKKSSHLHKQTKKCYYYTFKRNTISSSLDKQTKKI